MQTAEPPKTVRRRWRWVVVAACVGGVILAVAYFRPRHDRRFVGEWSFTPKGGKPTATFVFLEDGTGHSAAAASLLRIPLRWSTSGDWLFVDDPARDSLDRFSQLMSHVAVLVSGSDLGGRVECLKIVRVDESRIEVRSGAVPSTLHRIAE